MECNMTAEEFGKSIANDKDRRIFINDMKRFGFIPDTSIEKLYQPTLLPMSIMNINIINKEYSKINTNKSFNNEYRGAV